MEDNFDDIEWGWVNVADEKADIWFERELDLNVYAMKQIHNLIEEGKTEGELLRKIHGTNYKCNWRFIKK
jgi:hypothetical protein